jgi:cysteine desulfurase
VERAYLDHASSSPLRPEAYEAMLPFLRDHPGDPGRLHAEGLTARVALEVAREQVATRLGARPREVVFTASGTEAINAALWGALSRSGPGHVVTTAVEHSAVLAAARRSATAVTEVGVDRTGRFDADEVAAAIRDDTVLVSVQLANHEVGTLQPVGDVVAHARERGVVVHVDACAAVGHVDVDFGGSAADLCSVTAHKFGGPKGAAALLVRRGLHFPPFVVGGEQERARRAGVENVPAIVGFGAAALAIGADDGDRERALADRLAREVLESVAGTERFGDAEHRLPHVVCLGVEGVEAEPILLALDQQGVAVHSGSSCSSEALEPSPVLAAMGVDAERSLRISVGWSSTDADVNKFLAVFPAVVGQLRALRRGDGGPGDLGPDDLGP